MKYCITKLVDANLYAQKLDQFWTYFEKTWILRFEPVSWNITGACAGLGDAEDITVNRTNNPLERFNRELKKIFPTTPSMVNFITGIQEVSVQYVQKMQRIRQQRSKPKKKAAVKITKIPDDYASFVPPLMEDSTEPQPKKHRDN